VTRISLPSRKPSESLPLLLAGPSADLVGAFLSPARQTGPSHQYGQKVGNGGGGGGGTVG